MAPKNTQVQVTPIHGNRTYVQAKEVKVGDRIWAGNRWRHPREGIAVEVP